MNNNNRNDGLLCGFTTASGSSINITEKALLKAKKFFNKELEEIDNYEETFKNENDINVSNVQSSNVGFQTANGRNINVTNEALLKAQILFQEEISENLENTFTFPKSLQKRKIKDLDENIPLNKQVKSNQFKKLRFSNELQNSKVIYKNTINIEEETQNTSSKIISNCNNNKLIDNIDIIESTRKNNEILNNSFISNEIAASAVALLADEKDLDFSEAWKSPKEIKNNEKFINIPSSPVIGGRFISKKRKNTNKRKSIHKIDKSIYINDLEKLNDTCTNLNQCINEENKYSIENEKLINIENKTKSTINNDFGDTQLMIDFINQSVTILEKRLEAASKQDNEISLKQKNKPKPTISKLYFHRKNNAKNRISWKQLSKGKNPVLCTHEELNKKKLPLEILDITSNNALMYKFRCIDFYGENIVQNNIDGIKLEDGAYLILDENGNAGITEIKRSFLACPGVDPNLLSSGWVENHYKWIVWKLASIDRIKLGSVMLPKMLTPTRVVMELKYRYDREIDRSERSALRKILEKDDVATKRMVLCVSSIIEYDDSATNKSPNQYKMLSKKLILTDGWYSIQASIDEAMIKYIMSGKIKEGTKLLTYGSELLNCAQGCPPLEIPENVCLKLHTNSTRRARWDVKLGYMISQGPICIKLKSIFPNGGLIGKIKVIIARVYPMLYHEKTSTGESIFRNIRCEEKANIIYEKKCRSMIETFYAKAEKYFYTGKNKNDLNTDSIDLATIEWNENCDGLSKKEFLSEQEIDQIKNDCRMKEEKFKQELESRLQESLPPPRQVTPVLKIRVIEEETSAILSVWSPSEEVLDILKEGNYVSVSTVMPSAKRGNELQLTTNRNTIFCRINDININFSQRIYTALYDINKPIFTPVYGEFDTVGIVTSIGNEPYGMKNFQAVYLAYPHMDSQSSYLSILFWHGIFFYGYTEILTVGSFVACSNLEWRRATTWDIPMAYCTERSTFTRNPRHSHLQKPFENLKHLIKDANMYINSCAKEISEKIQKKPMTRISDKFILDANNLEKIAPGENINSNKQFNDYACQEFLKRNLLNDQPAKSVAIQKRLEKLQHYGEPCSLSPIILNNSSKRVSLEFKSPMRPGNEKSTKAHISLNAKFEQNSR